MKWQRQKDINGCGIACIANLLNKPYDLIKKDFESKFYAVNKYTKIFDIVSYLNLQGVNYQSKFFNRSKRYKVNYEEARKFSKIIGSITLIAKSDKYPIGHYLLRVKDGWVDSWINLPNIEKVEAGIRKRLPGEPWYVLYPTKVN